MQVSETLFLIINTVFYSITSSLEFKDLLELRIIGLSSLPIWRALKASFKHFPFQSGRRVTGVVSRNYAACRGIATQQSPVAAVPD